VTYSFQPTSGLILIEAEISGPSGKVAKIVAKTLS
jgi:hypothetical protein